MEKQLSVLVKSVVMNNSLLRADSRVTEKESRKLFN